MLRLRIAQLPESKNHNDNFLQTCETARSDYSKSGIFISWPCLRERVKEENLKRQNSFKGYFSESSDRNTSGKVIHAINWLNLSDYESGSMGLFIQRMLISLPANKKE